jgi:hypothetical protein
VNRRSRRCRPTHARSGRYGGQSRNDLGRPAATGHGREITPLSYLSGALLVLLVGGAFAALLKVPAPDESTTSSLALVVAAIGLVVAVAAAREASRAASAADESLTPARDEHAVFLAQLQAHRVLPHVACAGWRLGLVPSSHPAAGRDKPDPQRQRTGAQPGQDG